MSNRKSFFQLYMEKATNFLNTIKGSDLSESETSKLKSLLNERVKQHAQPKVVCKNNYYNTITEPDKMSSFLNYYYKSEDVMSGYGVLFKNKDQAVNPSESLLENLGSSRKANKKEMFKHINDADLTLFNMYNIRQLNDKLLMNSYYGGANEKSFFAYNEYVGPSVTYSGQIMIMTVMMALEGNITNSIRFRKTEDALSFINNVLLTPVSGNIYDYLDEDKVISKEKLIEYLCVDMKEKYGLDPDNYEKIYYENIDEEKVRIVVEKLTDEQVQHVYYKRNFYGFIRNEKVLELVGSCYDTEFLDPMEPEGELKTNLDNLFDILNDFVFYDQGYNDRDERARTMVREIVLTLDSDSTFMYLKPFIEFIDEYFERDMSRDTRTLDIENIAIMNIVIYIATKMIQTCLDYMSENLHVHKDHQHKLNMKSE